MSKKPPTQPVKNVQHMKNIQPIKKIQHIKTWSLEENNSRFASIFTGYCCRSDTFCGDSLQLLYVVRKFQLFILMCVLWQEQRERRFLPVRLINSCQAISVSLSLSLSKLSLQKVSLQKVSLLITAQNPE